MARLDRLTYSLIDLAELVREAVEGGFTIISLAPDVNLSSDGGRAVGEVLAEAASWQARPLTTAGRALAGRPGRPSSTPAPVAERIRELRGRGHDPPGHLRHPQRGARAHARAAAPSGARRPCARCSART